MTKPPQPELFAERPVRSDFARRGPSYALRRVITVTVLLGVIGGGLYGGFHHSSPTPSGQIPIVKADGNYKQRPAQPGGIDIPHQDVQVYQQLDNNAPDKPVVEHLLPPPEVPQPVPAGPVERKPAPPAEASENLVPPAPVPAPPAVKTESLDSIMSPETNPAPPVSTTVTSAPAPVPVAVQPVPQPAPLPVKPAVAAKPATKTIDQVLQDVAASSVAPPSPSAPAPDAATGPAIQLASTPDQSAAQEMAQKLQIKYASILGPARLRVVQADLGEKGIYYRVQSQSLSDEKASAICAAVKNLKAGCILVRR